MKIISGGGGVDADGNWYELPEVEREVPDDYFKRLAQSLKKDRARPAVMIVSQQILDDLRDA